jgi:sRNA-binding regulator protein Hfq
MGCLQGFRDYTIQHAATSIFDYAVKSGQLWCLHSHPGQLVVAKVIANGTYEVSVVDEAGQTRQVHKVPLKFLYPQAMQARVAKLVTTHAAIQARGLEPRYKTRDRVHLMNKTLYVAILDKTPLTVTTYEGEVLTGVLASYSRFEMVMLLDKGLPVAVLRHAVQLATDPTGRDLTQVAQKESKDYRRSAHWVEEAPPPPPRERAPRTGGAPRRAGGPRSGPPRNGPERAGAPRPGGAPRGARPAGRPARPAGPGAVRP